MFDPDTFANTEITEENSTVFSPVPVGEYRCVIDKAEPKVTPNGNALIEVTLKIDAPENEEANGRTVRYTVWLDLTDNGGLDMGKGKNVMLGRLRDAVNQNVAGQPWNMNMLVGNVILANIVHAPDKNDSNIIYANVKGIAKAA